MNKSSDNFDNNKLVSVVVPVYNGEDFLEKCVTSILNQTYTHFEVILIDDGSTDSSSEICDFFLKKDSRVRVLHRSNGGLPVARNNGIDIAKGKFILFVDADDYIETTMIETLILELNKGLDLVMCGYKKIFLDSNKKIYSINSPLHKKPNMSREEFLSDFGIYFNDYYINYVWNKLYHADIIKENNLEYDSSIGWGEDLLFNLNYLAYCNRISIIDDLLYNYVNYNENFITSKFNKNLFSYQQSMYSGVRKFLLKNNAYQGKNKDILETNYSRAVIACLFNQFHTDAGLTKTEKRSEINCIITNEIVLENIGYFKNSGIQGRIIGWIIKRKSITLILFYFSLNLFMKDNMKPLYRLLRRAHEHSHKKVS